MIREDKIERIREFYDLTDQLYTLRKFHKPVLVYDVADDKVRYSLWEAELLERFGLENVDGWDYTEDVFFCPDWMQPDLDDLEDFDEEDIDLDNDSC